jgi:hypothetical protein
MLWYEERLMRYDGYHLYGYHRYIDSLYHVSIALGYYFHGYNNKEKEVALSRTTGLQEKFESSIHRELEAIANLKKDGIDNKF